MASGPSPQDVSRYKRLRQRFSPETVRALYPPETLEALERLSAPPPAKAPRQSWTPPTPSVELLRGRPELNHELGRVVAGFAEYDRGWRSEPNPTLTGFAEALTKAARSAARLRDAVRVLRAVAPSSWGSVAVVVERWNRDGTIHGVFADLSLEVGSYFPGDEIPARGERGLAPAGTARKIKRAAAAVRAASDQLARALLAVDNIYDGAADKAAIDARLYGDSGWLDDGLERLPEILDRHAALNPPREGPPVDEPKRYLVHATADALARHGVLLDESMTSPAADLFRAVYLRCTGEECTRARLDSARDWQQKRLAQMDKFRAS